jgi:NAD(P)-dependent dehydrogenase (short-subunit alcohol dehydrogenase family)
MTLELAGRVAIVTGASKGIGRQIALEELAAFLATRELSRRKFPERLEVVDELPTSSGKVQKHVLRDAIAAKGRSA